MISWKAKAVKVLIIKIQILSLSICTNFKLSLTFIVGVLRETLVTGLTKQPIVTKSLHLFELHAFHLILSYAFIWNASTITSNALLTIWPWKLQALSRMSSSKARKDSYIDSYNEDNEKYKKILFAYTPSAKACNTVLQISHTKSQVLP